MTMTEVLETAVETTMEAAATDTDPAGSQIARETDEVTALTGEAADTVSEADNGATDTRDSELTFLPVYNGTVQPVRADDTARVTTLLQKGMKFEHMAGDLEKLHRLSADYGTKNVSELLDVLLDARQTSKKEAYIEQYGTEAGEKLFALEQEQQSHLNVFAQEQASDEALHQHLADDFVQLQKEYPNVANLHALPPEVIDLSLVSGISLLDAYNRHTLKEQQRIAAAAAQNAHNEQSATGSLKGGAPDGGDPVWDAFMQGVRRRA